MKKILVFVFILFALCKVQSQNITLSHSDAQTGVTTDYKLVWEDSFNGNKLDVSNWNVEVVANPANREYNITEPKIYR